MEGTQMRKITAVLAAVLLAAVGGAAVAFAQEDPGPVAAQTGQGKDAPCPDDPEKDCPDPVDPTAGLTTHTPKESPVTVQAGGDPAARHGGAAVAIGDEDRENSVGRAGVHGSEDRGNIQVYLEDYTDGNQLATLVAELNVATGCEFFPPDEGEECEVGPEDERSDAALITITPPAAPAP
jgi:hypothetical protein